MCTLYIQDDHNKHFNSLGTTYFFLGKPHSFTFDHSYWSHDPNDLRFVGQGTVFNDLGQDVVKNAFDGYNVCVFAYGQTGSGKTFTMMGSETDRFATFLYVMQLYLCNFLSTL